MLEISNFVRTSQDNDSRTVFSDKTLLHLPWLQYGTSKQPTISRSIPKHRVSTNLQLHHWIRIYRWANWWLWIEWRKWLKLWSKRSSWLKDYFL